MRLPRRWSSALLAAVILASLFAAQWISAREHDLTWSRVGEWHHDVSLYLALVLFSLLVGSRAASRLASRAPGGEQAQGALLPIAETALIVAARVGAALFIGVLLSFFGAAFGTAELGWVPLVAAAAFVGAAATIRWAVWPLAGAALVIALSAAWGTGFHDTVIQSAEPLVREPTYVSDLFPDGDETDSNVPPLLRWTTEFRRGPAPVLIDLRKVRVRKGNTLKIRARSDLDRVIVVLPQKRCLALRVRYRKLDRRLPESYLAAGRMLGLALDEYGGPPVSPATNGPDEIRIGEADGDAPPAAPVMDGNDSRMALIAYGEAVAAPTGVWTRDARVRLRQATLDLELSAGTQVIIRDYPADIPLDIVREAARSDLPRNEETAMLRWPVRDDVHLESFSLGLPTTPASGRRQAIRLAGACATEREQARRWVRIDGRRETTPGLMATWVNGLGEVKRARMVQR